MQKEQEDNKYTFVVEYRGGTYISQCLASCLNDAIEIWCRDLTVEFLSIKLINKLLSIYKNEMYYPVAIEGIDNVWCCSYTLIRSHILVNIIKTDRGNVPD